MTFIQYLATRDYSNLYPYVTLAMASLLTAFYIVILARDFNSHFPLHSLPALTHAIGATGITLLMSVTDEKSLMRIVQILTLLLLANLG